MGILTASSFFPFFELRPKKNLLKKNSSLFALSSYLSFYVAGSIGLEPILYATKKRCITIMLRPNVKAVYADFKYRASQKIVILTCFVPCMLLGEKYEKI